MPGPSLAKQLVAIVLLVLAGGGIIIGASSSAAAAEFVFSGFARENVTTSGAATVTSTGLLQLTNDTNEVFGHGFYPTFVAALVPRYPEAHGHGLALALAPSAQLPGALPGKRLGLFNASDDGVTAGGSSSSSSSNKVVAVELDTAVDAEFGDVDDNHVGVDVHGPRSVNATPAGHVGLSLISGAPLQVWVEYDGPSARIEVTVGPAGAPRPGSPLVSCVVDLASAVADETFVGFSAANGAAASSHYVLGWSFRLGGGGLAPELDLAKLPTLPSRPTKKKTPVLLVVALLLLSVVVLLLVSAAIAAVLVRRRRFAEEEEEDWEMERYGTHRIRYRDLHVATDGFRHVIGAGGFGTVYRGVLPATGEEVAVKKVAHDSRQGLREFVAEVASMSRLRHRSLVHLLGYCRPRRAAARLRLHGQRQPRQAPLRRPR
ncbi:hypothetical protein PR202_ga13999 [Eleusine coracana subsp. coracana]|uniref:non-specific serine/threonine protein kinase n=1 Tax=Eleusine coracana subsp. coracana TaxID=191504 RepID=A0AAV5CFN2_ELECO|nr:hypothetical protein PR202_ga13999 [Eleusine coracana subsp. coracana]